MLNRHYDRKIDEPGILTAENPETLTQFKDLNNEHWAYYEIQEAANTHRYTRRSKEDIVENWERIISDIVQ